MMRINPYQQMQSTAPVKKNASPAPVADTAETAAPRQDSPDVSPEARMLAANRAALNEMLKPRPKVVQKFAATINDPVDLQDRTIDRILSHMQLV